MDKFFDIIKKLRVPAQQGKISRQAAIDALMQESGVSEELAAKAADNMLATKPEVPGGITSIKPEVTFTPTQKELPEPIDMTVEERTGGLLTEEEAPGLFSLRRDMESLADEESWKYSMSLYKQKKSKSMEPVYQKYGAQSEKDKELVDELFDMDLEGKVVPNQFKSKPKYKDATAKIFIQESVEDIPGADDIVTEILYSDEATKFLENQGLDNYINYVHTQLKDQGLSFNKNLLKKFLKEKFEPEGFAYGGRIGFKDGPGKLGIIQSLLKKANEIAPGSTAVGKTTKAMSEKAARKRAEEELFAGFNERNKPSPTKTKDEVKKEAVEKYGFTPERFDEIMDTEFDEKILDEIGVEKAGQGQFTKAEVLENIINNTIKAFKDDPDVGDYVTNTLPNILKEIKANPELANNKNVFNNLTKQLVNNPTQKLVVYDDDTVDFFTRKLNANGGLNYLMGF